MHGNVLVQRRHAVEVDIALAGPFAERFRKLLNSRRVEANRGAADVTGL